MFNYQKLFHGERNVFVKPDEQKELALSWRENVGYNPTVRNGDFLAAIRNRLYLCIKLQNERASLFLAN